MTEKQMIEKCTLCGSTDPENVDTVHDPEYQGYSRCCNERVEVVPE